MRQRELSTVQIPIREIDTYLLLFRPWLGSPNILFSCTTTRRARRGLNGFHSELRMTASMYLTFAAHRSATQCVGVMGPGIASIRGIAPS